MKLSCGVDSGVKNFEASSICKTNIESGWCLIISFQIILWFSNMEILALKRSVKLSSSLCRRNSSTYCFLKVCLLSCFISTGKKINLKSKQTLELHSEGC